MTRLGRPGQSLGVIGDHLMVLLPPSEKDLAVATWQLVDAGADVAGVSALLAEAGERLHGFVLVGEADGHTHVAVRGPARVVAETGSGRIEVGGAEGPSERRLDGVTGLRLTVEDLPEESARPLFNGLLRVGLIETGTCVGAATGPPAVAQLHLPDGEVVDVDGPILVGRDPQGEGRLVRVPSPSREISATHAEFRPGSGDDRGRVLVTDLGSTNGTRLEEPGRPPRELPDGVPQAVRGGTVVDLGDGAVIRVTDA